MGADQRREPEAEAVIRLAGCGQAGAAMQLRAEQRIAKRGRRNQVDQRIGIVAGDRHTRGNAAMQR
jgi:hypothetical protein